MDPALMTLSQALALASVSSWQSLLIWKMEPMTHEHVCQAHADFQEAASEVTWLVSATVLAVQAWWISQRDRRCKE